MATLFNNVGVFMSKYFGGLSKETSSAVQSAVNEDLARTRHGGLDASRRFLIAFKDKLYLLITAIMIAVFSAAMHGDWLFILVPFLKSGEESQKDPVPGDVASAQTGFFSMFPNVHWWILLNLAISYITYFSLAGFLQWHFYIKQRDKPEEWKCQPDRWLTPEDERHEILLGSLNMIQGSIYSGFIISYLLNGGKLALYYSPLERGWLYLLISIPICFLWMDAGAYYFHRLFHEKYLYKYIHKWHHRYKAPTAFSATALHPVEFILFQGVLASPIFFLPMYSGAYVCILLYNYYYGMVDHSGIKLDAIWPWQPNSMFHDDHHKYFHVNFGFNLSFWDRMHDTFRKESRSYSEDIYGGKGREGKRK